MPQPLTGFPMKCFYVTWVPEDVNRNVRHKAYGQAIWENMPSPPSFWRFTAYISILKALEAQNSAAWPRLPQSPGLFKRQQSTAVWCRLQNPCLGAHPDSAPGCMTSGKLVTLSVSVSSLMKTDRVPRGVMGMSRVNKDKANTTVPYVTRYSLNKCSLCTYTHFFSCCCWVVSDSSRPHRLQHARFPCSSPSLRVCPSSCP